MRHMKLLRLGLGTMSLEKGVRFEFAAPNPKPEPSVRVQEVRRNSNFGTRAFPSEFRSSPEVELWNSVPARQNLGVPPNSNLKLRV